MSTRTSSSPQSAPERDEPTQPGWYQHPTDPSWDMYWNGSRWTRSRPHGVPHERSPGRVTATYLGACILPFTLAVVLPWPVFMAASPAGGAGSADAWTSAAGAAFLTGWGLWILGALGWLLGASLFEGDRPDAPDAVRGWHRTGRAWAIGVAAWGVLATTTVGLLLMMGLALGGVSNGL